MMLAARPEQEALDSMYLSKLEDTEQQQYLSYRFSGFSHKEACVRVPVDETRVDAWYENDAEFVAIAVRLNRDYPAQKSIRKEVLGTMFARNMRMVFESHARVLEKEAGLVRRDVVLASGEVVNVAVPLTEFEEKKFLSIMRYYSPQDILNIERALSGEGTDGKSVLVNLIYNTVKVGSDAS